MFQEVPSYAAQFPLTLTLSPGRGNSAHRAAEWRGFWTVPGGKQGSPSPQGRGLGWGESTDRTAARRCSNHRTGL